MKIRIAFYKYNKKPLNFGISLWTWFLNPFTPWYSHVEIGFEIDNEWKYFSSTLRDGSKGTRWIDEDKLFKHPKRWDIYEIKVISTEDMIIRAKKIVGLPYDLAGLTGFITPFGLPNKKNKWYCSEACYFVLTGGWIKRISPRRFYSYIYKEYKHTIRKVKT